MVTSIEYYPGYSQEQVTNAFTIQTIQSITNANPAVLTTVKNHNYVPGMMVRFLIPSRFGMQLLNAITCQVLLVTSNTLTLKVDTSNTTAFAYPSPLPSAYTPPSVIPNSSGPYLPPLPLPFGNQDSFEGVTYNIGEV